LQLFRKIHTFRGESRFSTWLHRLAVNVVLMRLRKKRYPEVSLDATTKPGEEDSRPLIELGRPDLRLNGLLDHINLSKAIDQLPNGCKEMFILHDVEGYEHNEIAKILGCSVGNSKSQLFQGTPPASEAVTGSPSQPGAGGTQINAQSTCAGKKLHDRFQCAKA